MFRLRRWERVKDKGERIKAKDNWDTDKDGLTRISKLFNEVCGTTKKHSKFVVLTVAGGHYEVFGML